MSNKYLVWAILSSLGLHLLVLYVPIISRLFNVVPLGGFEWFMIFMATAFVYVVNVLGIKVKNHFGWFEN